MMFRVTEQPLAYVSKKQAQELMDLSHKTTEEKMQKLLKQLRNQIPVSHKVINQTTGPGSETDAVAETLIMEGAIWVEFAPPEVIDSWKDQVELNHVTEANKSLRDNILKSSWELRENLNIVMRFEEATGSWRKLQKTCGESQRDWETDSEDEESYYEDEEGYGEDEDGYGEDEDGYGEDEDEDEDEESDDEDKESDDEDSEEESQGSDQGDDELYDNDEEVYQEEEENDSKEETEDESEQRKHYQKKKLTRHSMNLSSRNVSRKRRFESSLNPPAAIRAALLNVQSMNNKTPEISDIITENHLDVLCTTETWLQRRSAIRVLREASPHDFSFYYHVRPYRGGGVAVQVSNMLEHRRIWFPGTVTTFEAVATVLQHADWDEPVLVVNVYRPPGSNQGEFQMFLNQFEELLSWAWKKYNSVVLTGDFNVWFNPNSRSFTDEFLWLLPVYDLVQHVRDPTHKAGRTLDLVISRNVDIFHLSVRDNRISDHFSVYFSLRPKSDRLVKQLRIGAYP